MIPHRADDAAAPAIYPVLADHQRTEDWAGRRLIAELQGWAERFDVAFKLDVPEIALRVDGLRITRYGHFRGGHNGFGLKGEIALNARHLGSRPWWQVLGTLLHEMLHGWQQVHGRPGRRNYHNVEFRAKARTLGLIIDRRGVTDYATEGPFQTLLREHGIDVSEAGGRAAMREVHGESKLKKWACGCTNIRVAIGDFRARCLKCDRVFRRADRAPAHPD